MREFVRHYGSWDTQSILSGREGEKGERDGLHGSQRWTMMTCGMCDECGDIMGGGLMGFDRKL
jgi:hypothetical protein